MKHAAPRTAFTPGQSLYATHLIIGTELGTGCRATVVEVYREPRAETRYLVRTDGGFKVYCYESDLSSTDPLDRN